MPAVPIYFKPGDQKVASTTVVRCRFDGSQLRYVEHGNERTVDVDRGLYETTTFSVIVRRCSSLRSIQRSCT